MRAALFTSGNFRVCITWVIMSRSFRCEACHSTDFFVDQGITICSECLRESFGHGQETCVEDESLGLFSASQTLRRISIGKRGKKFPFRPRFRTEHGCLPFTMIDVFTHLLKSWANQLQSQFDVDNSLITVLRLVWAKYLQKVNLAFCDLERTKKTLRKSESYARDRQVLIYGRKRLLNLRSVKAFIKHRDDFLSGKSMKRKHSSSSSSDVVTDDDLDDYDERQRRRRFRRRRRRREFIKSVAAVEDASNSENGGISQTMSEGPSNDDEPWSETLFDPKFLNDMGLHNGEELLADETKRSMKTFSTTDRRIRKHDLLALFILSVLQNRHNELTLSDLLRLARGNAISYTSTAELLPKEIEITHDVKKVDAGENQLDGDVMRHHVIRLGSFMELGSVNFDHGYTFNRVMRRMLDELALPNQIHSFLIDFLPPTFLEFNQNFNPPKSTPLEDSSVFVEIRCGALILLALKYLCVPISETCSSSKTSIYQYDFDLDRWIEASQSRLLVLCRLNVMLHKQYKAMVGHTEPTLAATKADLKDAFDQSKDLEGRDNERRRRQNNEIASVLERAFNLQGRKSTELESLALKINTDLKSSLKPLKTATKIVVESLREAVTGHLDPDKAETWRSEEQLLITNDVFEALTKLLVMSETKMTLSKGRQALFCRYATIVPRSKSSERLVVFDDGASLRNRSKFVIGNSKEDYLYWGFIRDKNLPGRLFQASLTDETIKMEEDLRACLPDNFLFVLDYLASYLDTSAATLYAELMRIESKLEKDNAMGEPTMPAILDYSSDMESAFEEEMHFRKSPKRSNIKEESSCSHAV